MARDWSQEYDALWASVKKEFPKTEVRLKDHWTQTAIHYFLLIISFGQQKKYLTDYITVIGWTIWVPSKWEGRPAEAKWSILAHECMGHMRQRKRWTRTIFRIAYLFLPMPLLFAYCRYCFEREAYAFSMLAAWLRGGDAGLMRLQERAVKELTGPMYIWTWVIKSQVKAYFDAVAEKISTQFHPEVDPLLALAVLTKAIKEI